MKQYLCLLTARDTFMEDQTPEEAAIIGQHVEYLKVLLAEGRVILAGPCEDGPLGIVVFEAESDEAARQTVDADPAVKAGLFTTKLRPYHVAMMRGG